jgi:lipid II:glycine glycyltransferase (peptidoglycan interpeptide bridge formation enzyme)
MPYLIRKKAWMKYIVMPQQTQIGGMWIASEVPSDKVSEICQDFACQLADLGLSYYYQHYPIGSPAVNAMHALGFKTKERVTYRIEDLSDLDKVINAFSKNKKRQLQKALSLHAETNMSVEDFYRFHVQCLQEQGKQISYSREFLLVLHRKTQRLGQSQILSICNADNQVLAAAFLVWDKQSMYYLIPCYDLKYKDSGASALLPLEAIKLARQQGVAFDFEGSMIRGVANHYKQFGSTRTIYYGVEKYYKWYFWLANAYNWLRERKMR